MAVMVTVSGAAFFSQSIPALPRVPTPIQPMLTLSFAPRARMTAGPASTAAAAVVFRKLRRSISPLWYQIRGSHLMRLVDLEELVGRHILEHLLGSARPADFYGCDLGLVAQAEMDALVARRHKTHADGHMVVEHAAGSRGDFDFSAYGVARALMASQAQDQPVITAIGGVHQDARLVV